MNLFLYIFIFLCKVLENALATLRLIVISNGKKMLGAILAGATSLLWVFTTGIVVVDIKKDPLRVFFFCAGTFVGSYIGSKIEAKLAMGNNIITCIIDHAKEQIIDTIREQGYAVTVLKGAGKESEKLILMILLPRKKRKQICDFIQSLDQDAVIIAEKVIPIIGGYQPTTTLERP